MFNVYCNNYISTKNKYNNDIDSLNYFFAHVTNYDQPILKYYNYYKKMPKKIEDTYNITTNTNYLNEMNIIYWYWYYKDPIFSSSNRTVKYLPLYSRKSNKIEYYFIISAGIDKKFNNNIPKKDTIYVNEALNYFKFYNTIDTNTNVELVNRHTFPKIKNLSFKLKNYLFGKKDVVLLFYNAIAGFLISTANISYFDSLETNYNFLTEHNPSFYNFRAKYIKRTQDTLIFENKGYKIKCSLYNDKKIKTDSLYIYGIFSEFDTINDIIKFDNCIISDTSLVKQELNDIKREKWDHINF